MEQMNHSFLISCFKKYTWLKKKKKNLTCFLKNASLPPNGSRKAAKWDLLEMLFLSKNRYVLRNILKIHLFDIIEI